MSRGKKHLLVVVDEHFVDAGCASGADFGGDANELAAFAGFDVVDGACQGHAVAAGGKTRRAGDGVASENRAPPWTNPWMLRMCSSMIISTRAKPRSMSTTFMSLLCKYWLEEFNRWISAFFRLRASFLFCRS